MTSTEKKLATRKAPAEKANTYEEGYVADGSDDIPYVVKADKKGVKKWVKQKDDENPAAEKSVEPAADTEESDKDTASTDNPKTPEPKKRADNTDEKVMAPKKKAVAKEEKAPTAAEAPVEAPKKKAVALDKNGVPKPKRTPTSYINFIKIMFPKLREEQPGEKSTTYMTMAGAIWKGLTDDEKKTYLPAAVAVA